MNSFFNETIMTNSAKKSKKPHSVIIETLIFIALFFVISLPQSIVQSFVQIYYMFKDATFMAAVDSFSETLNFQDLLKATNDAISAMPPSTMIIALFSTIFIIGGTILYCTKIEKRSLYSMGFSKKKIAFEYLIGLLIGFVIFSLAVLICLLTKTMTIDQLNPQIPIGMILLFFIGYLFQGASEELLCRGYFMISLTRNKTFVTAILANSLVFSALHLLNPGVTLLAILNIALFGVFASIYILKRGSIWGAFAMHSMWNFAQGNLYGIKVSGLTVNDSIFTSSITESGKHINGGSFGLEGGLAVTIVLIISIVVALSIKTNKNELLPIQTNETQTTSI